MENETKRKPSYTVRLNEIEEKILEYIEAELGFGSTAEAVRYAVKYLYLDILYGLGNSVDLRDDKEFKNSLKNILDMVDDELL